MPPLSAVAHFFAAALLLAGPSPKINPKSVRRVHITGTVGELKVRGTQPAQARVQTADPACSLAPSMDAAGTLTVAVNGCKTDLEVFVPMHVDTVVEAQQGTVYVSGVRGSLALQLGHVNAVVGGQLTQLKVQGEESSVSATGMLANSEILIHSGNVQLWYDKQAVQGLILLHVDDGNVTLSLPGSQVTAKVRLEQGDLQNALDLAPAAPFVVDGVITHGSLFIRKAL